MKKSTIFYDEWKILIEDFPLEDKLAIYEIFSGARTIEEITNPYVLSVAKFILKKKDENNEKYEDIREKRKEAIKKRWDKKKKTDAEVKKEPSKEEPENNQNNYVKKPSLKNGLDIFSRLKGTHYVPQLEKYYFIHDSKIYDFKEKAYKETTDDEKVNLAHMNMTNQLIKKACSVFEAFKSNLKKDEVHVFTGKGRNLIINQKTLYEYRADENEERPSNHIIDGFDEEMVYFEYYLGYYEKIQN